MSPLWRQGAPARSPSPGQQPQGARQFPPATAVLADGSLPVLTLLKSAWSRLAGGGAASPGPAIPTVEYKGYRIRPEPYRTKDQYQTAGTIEKVMADGIREHRFIRADTYHSREDAIAFTIAKAKQIIDQQGDRIFA